MRLFANRHIRKLLLAVIGILFFYAFAIQCLNRQFSFSLLLLSFAVSMTILVFFIDYFKKQDTLLENAVDQINLFLSGQKDERIECNEEGELFYLFQTINNLSSVSAAQTEREKQTNEFLKTAISDISHQLKTPLSALGVYNELISDAESMDDVRHFSEASGAELTRIDVLVKNLLKIYRMDAGAITFEKHSESIAEIMDDLKQRFSYRAEIENKKLVFEGEDIIFNCDYEWISEAFGNIVKNAIDHTSDGGIISVKWVKKGNILNVMFRDNGSGIHPEDLNHIFKRFYRSRFSQDTQGIGLGLPLAKTIIEMHGGIIEVDSELGKGTTFSVSFLIPTKL